MPILGSSGAAASLPSGGSDGDVLVHSGSTGVWAGSATLAQSGQTPSQSPAAPGTVAVGSLAQAARADHVHASSGLYAMFGSGSDGDLVLDGTSAVAGFSRSGTTYTQSGPVFANNLTVNSGVTLVTNLYILFVAGTLTNSGTISTKGGNGSGATAGAAVNTNGSLGIGGNGGAGGTGAGATGQTTRTPTNANPANQQFFGGGGGAGGTGASGAAGAATAQYSGSFFTSYPGAGLIRSAFYAFSGLCPAFPAIPAASLWGGNGGASGGGDGTNSGGGGGAGGGPIVINARLIVNAGTITTAGGVGATPATGNCGGGGGGGGGPLIINTTTTLTGAGTTTAAGGAAGSGVGTGTAGAAGTAGYTQTTVWA